MNNNSMNLNNQSMENIKNLVDNGNISEAISQISPEMIQNFSKILSSQKNENQTQNSQTQQNNVNSNFQNEQTNSAKAQNNDFNFNIDMNTIKNISSIMGNMNNTKNDPRANLLASLKPYLRDSKKSQLDNYMNLLNVTKIAEIMKNTNTNNKEN